MGVGIKTKLVLLLLIVSPALTWGDEDSGVRECSLTHPRNSLSINARCQDFFVPLKPGQAESSKIRLHVAVIPSLSKSPKPDPLFFFAGGPGQSAVNAAVPMWPLFRKILRQRSIVLIDQRGTGQSTPLACPQYEALDLISDDHRLVQKTRECLENLGVDVRFFTSLQAVEDVEFVRKALGYKRINLMGVSYGTRVAQLFLSAYPNVVRSVVLDGVLPMQIVLGPEFSANFEASMREMIKDCNEDRECSRAFPELEKDWAIYLNIPVSTPRSVELTEPRTGEKLSMTVSRQGMDSAVRLLSYTSETRALLPLLIHETARGDWSGLLTQALLVNDAMDAEMALGMHNSVVCNEDIPFASETGKGDNRVLGDMLRQLRLICNEWPVNPSIVNIHQPVQSDTPALLLSGEEDPVTPAHYGELALDQFSRGRHLVVPGQAHHVSVRGCIPQLIADFVDSLNLDESESACARHTPRLPFFIDKLGPGS